MSTLILDPLAENILATLRLYDWPWQMEKEIEPWFDAEKSAIKSSLDALVAARKLRVAESQGKTYYEVP